MHKRSQIAVGILFALLALGASGAAVLWTLQPRTSTLTFTASQAGAQFEGAFEEFTAGIRFDPKDLAASRFDVTIDLTSLNSRDSERDEIIAGPDLFAVQQWPTARYVAETFTSMGGGKYRATGNLTLRNVTRSVPVDFTFSANETGASLTGTANIRRLDFGVGQGEWRDTQWVGDEVGVHFMLALK